MQLQYALKVLINTYSMRIESILMPQNIVGIAVVPHSSTVQ